MPKVTAVEEMGNFEVLEWIKDTKKRHEREDRALEAEGVTVKPRPDSVKKAFDEHERYLTRDFFPYSQNPSVHSDKYDVDGTNEKFNKAVIERVFLPIQRKYTAKVLGKEMTKKEGQVAYEKETEPKMLTEMELMQLHNLAPKTMEALQLCIESWEDRFTEEELGKLLAVVLETFRPDELAKQQALSAEGKGMDE